MHFRKVTLMNPSLVYDVGMNNGDDTAYYLHFIPWVAALASKRFDRHYSHLIEPGAS